MLYHSVSIDTNTENFLVHKHQTHETYDDIHYFLTPVYAEHKFHVIPLPGNTWMSEIVHQIRHGGLSPVDLRSGIYMGDLYPFIEFRTLGAHSFVHKVNSDPSIVGIRTHLRPEFFERMLEDTFTCPKIIVVLRNPKDVLVSLFHFERSRPDLEMNETFDEFFERYRDNGLKFGNVIDHIVSWWRYKEHRRVHIVLYEDLLDDFEGNIRQLAKFLECPLSVKDEERVHRESCLTAMRSRGARAYHKDVFIDESVQPFFRKGIKGDWRTTFSSEHQKYMDQHIKARLHPLGLYIDLNV